jgi:hypothetical protein
LRHLDRLLAAMCRGGCSVGLGHHAQHLLGSDPAMRAVQVRATAELYPNVADLALAASHDGGLGGCDDDAEFNFTLDVLLDASSDDASPRPLAHDGFVVAAPQE